MKALNKLEARQSGIALLTTILLLLLMSSLLVGLMIMVTSGQRLSGMNSDYARAFYGAEAGMEKMTADLGTLFNNTYSPSAAQLAAVTSAPPNLPGIQFINPDGTSGYKLTYPVNSNGNPAATNITIKSGPYQGMIALATPYTLTVTAHTANGAEVKLERTTQTVGIPMFQFGIFSETDLSFFAGPTFNFGGRVHTNGNLFLAEGDGNTLTMADRVTAFKDVIRTNLSNGWPTSSNYNGTVNITTAPGTGSYRALAQSEGSVKNWTTTPQPNEPTWSNLSLGAYAGNIRGGKTAPSTPLRLAVATLGNAQPIDLIRRPVQNEDATNAGVLGERFFAQASLKILLSDDPQDIMQLPCIDTSVQPFHLDDIARTVASWATADAVALGNAMVTAGTPRVPLAASAGGAPPTPGNYTPNTYGYWHQSGTPTVSGYIKIEAQVAYGSPCGTWRDVTREILSLGYAGRNLNPQASWTALAPTLGPLPGSELAPSTCADPHPNAVIRLERIRDNPSNYNSGTAAGRCGMNGGTPPTQPMDYWPNVLFDTREGTRRDVKPAAPFDTRVTLGGVMHYVELDVNNLARWFNGAIGTSGPLTKDATIAPYNFVVYFSDRRSNYVAAAIPGGWPPASPTGHETGEYGFEDFVNPANQYGCPNNTVDGGEDLDSLGSTPFFTYGQVSPPVFTNTQLTGFTAAATVADPNCAVAGVWPGTYLLNSNEARQNPPAFFRRALKIVNGGLINLGTCPGGVACGLTIATENPVYVQGDYNCGSSPTCTGFNNPHVAAAVVADSFSFLSRNWNDVNSFKYPYDHASASSGTPKRNALTTWYRLGIVAGKGQSFRQPVGYSTPQDFGTDGGVHNFLRFVEDWGGQTLNYRGSILSMYYNRQGIGVYKCCTTVYSPPTRGYNFDVEFLQPSLLPPRTPMFRDVNTTGFSQLILPKQ
jgi:Tfp pilus assembly protein PilX